MLGNVVNIEKVPGIADRRRPAKRLGTFTLLAVKRKKMISQCIRLATLVGNGLTGRKDEQEAGEQAKIEAYIICRWARYKKGYPCMDDE